MSINLSNAQRELVEASDGHYLVVASAGSGKTRVLTERVRHLLEVRKTRSRILALTFTNKAAEEMRQRLQDVPDVSDRTFIGTIHSFCQTLVEAHGTAIGYPAMPAILERESDRIAMLEEVFSQSAELGGYLRRHQTPKERRTYLYGVLEKISLCKRDWKSFQAILNGEWSSHEESQAFLEYQQHLTSQGVIDFDDILLLSYRILSERAAIAAIYHRTYRYLFVDEAQDLNAVQYAIIRTLGEKAASVLLVGDPNQAIYGFNGSSKEFMVEEFPRDFTAKRVDLRENFRSSRAVIRTANSLYPHSIELENAALEGELDIAACTDEAAEAIWVRERIAKILADGKHDDIEGRITPDRIAVLARNRYVFGPLQEELEKYAIEYHLRLPGGGAPLESDLGRVFDLGIRILVNPKNRLHYEELRRRLGVSGSSTTYSENPLALVRGACEAASESCRSFTVPLLVAWALIHTDVNKFPKALDDLEGSVDQWDLEKDGQAEARLLALADLSFLRTVWANYTRRSAKDSRSLAQFRNQMATGETVPNVQGRGVTLATVHAVKGLEYDIVFIMGLVEGGFPDYRAVKAGAAALTEEKNDAFVAVTRSKRLLYLTWPRNKFMPWDKENRVSQRRSRFLDAIERNNSYPAETEALSRGADVSPVCPKSPRPSHRP
jgi:DNA helicase-2/ATP-dependent DNA helicase PcrA